MAEKFIVNSIKSLDECLGSIADLFVDKKYISVTISDRRTLDKNALMHCWYRDIAKSKQDSSARDIEREYKLNVGTKILRRDSEMHDWLYSKTLDLLTYEQQIKLMDSQSVTREMSNKQMSEYLDDMKADNPWLQSKKPT